MSTPSRQREPPPRRAGRRGDQPVARPDPALAHRERRAAAPARRGACAASTSNPAIFEKAILGSSDYDEQIEELPARAPTRARSTGRSPSRDVRSRGDVLRPVYDEHRRRDGFVSLEVDPDLAFDTDRTIAQAREYWERVDRPNVMIKIPGTPRASRRSSRRSTRASTSTSRCCSASRRTRTVAEAYIRGLERRHAEGKSLDVHSVASFFVSRVDTEVDKRLEELGREDLQGQAGVANARAAYQRFEEIFDGERFAELRAAGAPSSARCGRRPASRTRATPTRCTSTSSSGPTPSTRCRWRRCWPSAERGEVQRDPCARTRAPTSRRSPRPASTWTTSPTSCCATASTRSSRRWRSCWPAIEAKREAIVTGRPETIDPRSRRSSSGRRRARSSARVDEDVARRIWEKDPTLWGGPPRRPRSPTGSAG